MIKPIFASLLALLLPLTVQANSCDALGEAIPDIKLVKVVEGLDSPVTITHANDGSGRLFVVEQEGRIREINNDQLVKQPFLDIHDRVVDGGERGLLGLAFHPNFKANGQFYVNYTTELNDQLYTVVSEFQVITGLAKPGSERILLTVSQPWGNHNGGQLAFGPDGYLYIAMGDGGAGDDPHNNGQKLDTLLGSILRIDVDRQPGKNEYAIPIDNPFITTTNARPEIWAYGLRNPWRFSFDRKNGDLYAADVGQDEVEEINIINKGLNYGWRVMEGPICTPGVDPNCDKHGYTYPIYSYDHEIGASITGGYVYRGQQFPELCGVYIYGDFVSQAIWGLRYKDGEVVAQKTLFEPQSLLSLAIDYFDDDGLLISTFGEDEAGEIYVAAYQSGRIYRISKK
ncbi:MAG: PQQ-dependent sugar dehydrogenase [Gammaproteobacteria bacterium]|nr:PQQ-dependent sugar dehydrogenase [Gammaproteobacteria bacterium]